MYTMCLWERRNIVPSRETMLSQQKLSFGNITSFLNPPENIFVFREVGHASRGKQTGTNRKTFEETSQIVHMFSQIKNHFYTLKILLQL